MHPIVGVWSLIDWRRVAADGKVAHPFGEKPVGLLAYMPDGQMMVQMLASDRAPIDSPDPVGGRVDDRAQAYSTCLAYFGTYTVVGDTIEHYIKASLYPNWSGKTAARGMVIERGTLILRTDPAVINGVSIVNEMSWRRVSGASASHHNKTGNT
ncbi:MAG: lipocalin-like domain-containing protein [Nitrospira sp.]|nr:lipocalin-like domain-containing protein [Nitrospira sp.]